MRNVLTLTSRELRAYFVSPVAYVVMAGFLVINGYLFANILLATQDASLRYLFSNMGIILLLVSPVLSMRLLSEEQKSGTIELLLTSPVRDLELVLGKFVGALAFLVALLGLTGYYPLVLYLIGKPDWGPVLSGYLGVLLLGGAFLALGLLTSSLTQNQIVAAVLGFAVLLVLWLFNGLANFNLGPQVGAVVQYMGLSDHFDDFTKGVIDVQHVVYYLSIMAVSVFLAARVVEARRWK